MNKYEKETEELNENYCRYEPYENGCSTEGSASGFILFILIAGIAMFYFFSNISVCLPQ